jgi:hypothetical protein
MGFQWLSIVACGLVLLVSIGIWRQHPPGQRRALLLTAVVAGCILVLGVVRLLNDYLGIH